MRTLVVLLAVVPIGSCSLIVDTESLGSYEPQASIRPPVGNCEMDLRFAFSLAGGLCLVDCSPVDLVLSSEDSVGVEVTEWSFEKSKWLAVTPAEPTTAEVRVKLSVDGAQCDKEFGASDTQDDARVREAVEKILGKDVTPSTPLEFGKGAVSVDTQIDVTLTVADDVSTTVPVGLKVNLRFNPEDALGDPCPQDANLVCE